MRVPLHDDIGTRRGFVYLDRSIEKEKVLFQVSSLLDTFSEHFPVKVFCMHPKDIREMCRKMRGTELPI